MRGLVAVGLLVIATPRPARACSGDFYGVSDRVVTPPDGAANVPRNARVLVYYDTAGGDPGSTLELRLQGGATVAATLADVTTDGFARLLIPSATLEASTTYELLDTLALPCRSESASECVAAPSVIASFTTSAALDTTAPTLGAVTVSHNVDCFGETCDFEAVVPFEQIQVENLEDDQPIEWIRFQYVSPTGEVLAGPTAGLTISRRCSGTPAYQIGIPVRADAELRAVDLAGNIEPTSHPIGARTCADVDDACIGPTWDAGAADSDAGGSPADGDADGG